MGGGDKSEDYPDDIDRHLRMVYENVLNEDLPDGIKHLLEKLRNGQEPNQSGEDGS